MSRSQDAPLDGLDVITDTGYRVVRLLTEGERQAERVLLVERSGENKITMVVRVPDRPHSEEKRRLLSDFGRIKHDHICGLQPQRDGVSAGYSVWEWWPGRDVEGYLAERTDRSSELQNAVRVFWIADQLFQALGHLHKFGFCHLDVKPDHFILNVGCAGKLIGFSRLSRLDAILQVTHFSPCVAPPEVLRGDRIGGQATDIYQLAATVHRLLTGRYPHYDEDLLDAGKGAFLPRLLKRREAPYAIHFLTGVSAHWYELFARAFHPRVEVRYPSVAAMRLDFHYLIQNDIERLATQAEFTWSYENGRADSPRDLYERYVAHLDAGLDLDEEDEAEDPTAREDEPIPSLVMPLPAPPPAPPPAPTEAAPDNEPARPGRLAWLALPALTVVVLVAYLGTMGSDDAEESAPTLTVGAMTTAAPVAEEEAPPEATPPAAEPEPPVEAAPVRAAPEQAAGVTEGEEVVELPDGGEVKVRVTARAVHVFEGTRSRRVPLSAFSGAIDPQSVAEQVRRDPAAFRP